MNLIIDFLYRVGNTESDSRNLRLSSSYLARSDLPIENSPRATPPDTLRFEASPTSASMSTSQTEPSIEEDETVVSGHGQANIRLLSPRGYTSNQPSVASISRPILNRGSSKSVLHSTIFVASRPPQSSVTNATLSSSLSDSQEGIADPTQSRRVSKSPKRKSDKKSSKNGGANRSRSNSDNGCADGSAVSNGCAMDADVSVVNSPPYENVRIVSRKNMASSLSESSAVKSVGEGHVERQTMEKTSTRRVDTAVVAPCVRPSQYSGTDLTLEPVAVSHVGKSRVGVTTPVQRTRLDVTESPLTPPSLVSNKNFSICHMRKKSLEEMEYDRQVLQNIKLQNIKCKLRI